MDPALEGDSPDSHSDGPFFASAHIEQDNPGNRVLQLAENDTDSHSSSPVVGTAAANNYDSQVPSPKSPSESVDLYQVDVQEATPMLEPSLYRDFAAMPDSSTADPYWPNTTGPTTYIDRSGAIQNHIQQVPVSPEIYFPEPHVPTFPELYFTTSPAASLAALPKGRHPDSTLDLPPSPGGGSVHRQLPGDSRKSIRFAPGRQDSASTTNTSRPYSYLSDDAVTENQSGYYLPVPARLGFEARSPFKLRSNAPRLTRSRKSTQESGRGSDGQSVHNLENNVNLEGQGVATHEGHGPSRELGDVAEDSEVVAEQSLLDHPGGVHRHTSWKSNTTIHSGGTPGSPSDIDGNSINMSVSKLTPLDEHVDLNSAPHSPSNTAPPVSDTPYGTNPTTSGARDRAGLAPGNKEGDSWQPSHLQEIVDNAANERCPSQAASLIQFLLSFVFRYGWIALAGIYSSCLLHLPSLYCSRVSKIFEEAQLSIKQLETMALEMGSTGGLNHSEIMLQAFSAPENLHPSFKFLAFSWEKFVDGLIKEWKTLNIISALLLSAILTLLQIPHAEQDPITKYVALYSLLCALASLVYGCIYIIRFNTMREPSKAVEWAAQAEGQRGPKAPEVVIWWNVWVLLAMPAVWLTWSLVLYISAIMCFVWRSETLDPSTRMSNNALIGVRVVFSMTLLIAIIYGCLMVVTFRKYGEAMDNKWKECGYLCEHRYVFLVTWMKPLNYTSDIESHYYSLPIPSPRRGLSPALVLHTFIYLLCPPSTSLFLYQKLHITTANQVSMLVQRAAVTGRIRPQSSALALGQVSTFVGILSHPQLTLPHTSLVSQHIDSRRVRSHLLKKRSAETMRSGGIASRPRTQSTGYYGNPVRSSYSEFPHPDYFIPPYDMPTPGQVTNASLSPPTRQDAMELPYPYPWAEPPTYPQYYHESQNGSPSRFRHATLQAATGRVNPLPLDTQRPSSWASTTASLSTHRYPINLNAPSVLVPFPSSHFHRQSIRKDSTHSPSDNQPGASLASGVGMPRSQSIPSVPTTRQLRLSNTSSEATRFRFQPFKAPDVIHHRVPLPPETSPIIPIQHLQSDMAIQNTGEN